MQARRNFVVVVAGQHYQHRQAAGAAQRCDSSDMEILAQLISACLTVTAWDSDSSPYCVPVPVLLVGIGTTVLDLVPVLLVLLLLVVALAAR